VRAVRLTRDALSSLDGRVLLLTHDVRDEAGRMTASKGMRLTSDVLQRLAGASWDQLHAVELDADEVAEDAAGQRLGRAAAGNEVEAGAMAAGHWPLYASARGIVHVDVDALRQINALGDLVLYTLYDGQVVEAREAVARAKIIPFAVPRAMLEAAEAVTRRGNGVIHVRRFLPRRVSAVIMETLGERAMTRARAVLDEKIRWFGSSLHDVRESASGSEGLAAALRAQLAGGSQLLIVAGSRPMDPLDSMYETLSRLGARLERRGVPAHPGSLLWLATLPHEGNEHTILGLPSCGLFTQASVFDLVLPRLLADERLTSDVLADLGHGGLLTRDMLFRFPPYRSSARRGEILDE
jgi:molybdenum cofactor cytidylyltransferase